MNEEQAQEPLDLDALEVIAATFNGYCQAEQLFPYVLAELRAARTEIERLKGLIHYTSEQHEQTIALTRANGMIIGATIFNQTPPAGSFLEGAEGRFRVTDSGQLERVGEDSDG